MGSKHLGTDIVIAWPTAEIAVMGPQGAIEIIYKKQIKNEKKPDSFIKKIAKEYREKFANPYFAASRGYVDMVIEPSETRPVLIKTLKYLLTKRPIRPKIPKKHGIMPL